MTREDLEWARWILKGVTIFVGALWMGLISFSWAAHPDAIGTFMFQFLHATSFILLIQDVDFSLRIGVTGFFILTDILCLVLRIIFPVLPAWSAVHILSIIHSAIVLLLAFAQAFIIWYPEVTRKKKIAVIS